MYAHQWTKTSEFNKVASNMNVHCSSSLKELLEKLPDITCTCFMFTMSLTSRFVDFSYFFGVRSTMAAPSEVKGKGLKNMQKLVCMGSEGERLIQLPCSSPFAL